MAVGGALLIIRDSRLYREKFNTFNDYCKEKWGLERTYAHRLMKGSLVAANLSGTCETRSKDVAPGQQPYTPCEILPIYEKQVRPLAQLEPAQQREVWDEAVKAADGRAPTYNIVKAAVGAFIGPAPSPNPPSASHSGLASSGPLRRAPFAPTDLYP